MRGAAGSKAVLWYAKPACKRASSIAFAAISKW